MNLVGFLQDFLGTHKILNDPKNFKRSFKVLKDPWRDKIMPNCVGFLTRICSRVLTRPYRNVLYRRIYWNFNNHPTLEERRFRSGKRIVFIFTSNWTLKNAKMRLVFTIKARTELYLPKKNFFVIILGRKAYREIFFIALWNF